MAALNMVQILLQEEKVATIEVTVLVKPIVAKLVGAVMQELR